MNIFEKIKTAVDRNIIVYDMDAGEGILTKRLLGLMSTCMRSNSKVLNTESNSIIEHQDFVNCEAYKILLTKCNLHTIVVNKDIQLDNDVIDLLTLDVNDKSKIKVEFADFDLNAYYLNGLDASLPYLDRQVILAIADISKLNGEYKEEYLMGSC